MFLQHRPVRRPLNNPNTDADSGPKQELKGDVLIPKSGKISIPFFPPFKIPASCSFFDKKKGIVEVLMDSPEGVILKGKKGHTIHYDCKGLQKDAI